MSQVHLSGCRAASISDCDCEVRRYTYIFLLTLLIIAIQFAGSLISGSLALLADTAHASLDGAAAVISIYVAHKARSLRDTNVLRVKWMRISNSMLLIALGWIVFEAIERFNNPHTVVGWQVIVAAVLGGLINVWQHQLVPHDHQVTSKAQRLHVVGDLASSVVVVVGGVLIWITGLSIIDPMLSLLVVLMIGYPALRMLFSKHGAHGHDGHVH